jgi:hypothetical protein
VRVGVVHTGASPKRREALCGQPESLHVLTEPGDTGRHNAWIGPATTPTLACVRHSQPTDAPAAFSAPHLLERRRVRIIAVRARRLPIGQAAVRSPVHRSDSPRIRRTPQVSNRDTRCLYRQDPFAFSHVLHAIEPPPRTQSTPRSRLRRKRSTGPSRRLSWQGHTNAPE